MPEDVNFTEIDAGKLKDEFLARMEVATGEALYPGDERRIFAEGVAYAMALFVSSTNESCKARLLKYASGYALDALGERVGCTRLKPMPACTRLKFSLAAVRSIATIIPAGTRCTADNVILWATDVSCAIPAGELTTEVSTTATVGGSKTNGIPVGTVQTFVDDVPFVAGVVNLTESAGGDDGEPYPIALDTDNGDDGSGDDRYRERITLAPSAYSATGTAAGYEYYARSASSAVDSVKVMSNQAAGSVDIYICESDGADPSEETLEKVRSVVTADDVKALGDKVSVHAPVPVPYAIDIVYYCTQATLSETIQAIEGVNGAIAKYRKWQDSSIGRDINPDRLRAFCLDSCLRMEVNSPIYTEVSDMQIARWNGETITGHIIVAE